MSTLVTPPVFTHRIGAVSALSGVPVPTLRVWELRYQAFSPQKSQGQHRLYHDEDVLRATLLRQLTEAGHGIGSIAPLGASRLSALLNQQRSARARQGQRQAPSVVPMAIVGLPLAARVESKKFSLSFSANAIAVTDIFASLDEAASAQFASSPHILLVRINSLHAGVQTPLHQLVAQHRIRQVIVLYNFGQERVVETMKMAGMMVRREPISDADLADLISSVLLIDPAQSMGGVQPGVLIPPRQYSDETLARVAAISTDVLCECPRHVAELITQLASFEQYSQECLNKSAQDAHLHAYLRSVSGSARALFERALEMVAEHEGIALGPTLATHPQPLGTPAMGAASVV